MSDSTTSDETVEATAASGATAAEGGRNTRRSLQGVVTSNAMDKSIVVRVERITRHAKYGKFVRSHEKYMAHDEENQANVGDTVDLISTRPLSKSKRWRLGGIVRRSQDGGAE